MSFRDSDRNWNEPGWDGHTPGGRKWGTGSRRGPASGSGSGAQKALAGGGGNPLSEDGGHSKAVSVGGGWRRQPSGPTVQRSGRGVPGRTRGPRSRVCVIRGQSYPGPVLPRTLTHSVTGDENHRLSRDAGALRGRSRREQRSRPADGQRSSRSR